MSSPASAPVAATPEQAVHAIRTLALVGPSGAGKTLLAEALLHRAGMIGTPGSLERGSTVSDFDALERKLGHSLCTSVMHLDHDGCLVHLLDTPGAPDFVGQALPALEAVETAAIVVNACTGIEPAAIRLMQQAAERHLDRLIIVNKIDAAPDALPALLASLRAVFGEQVLPLNLPAAGATQVVDCFYNRQGDSDFSSVADAHRALVEQVVEVDEAFVERYLTDGDVPATELHAPLEAALRQGHLIPVCFVSARTGAGVPQLLDVIERLLPDPTEANPPELLNGEGEAALPLLAQPDPAAHVLAHVFKLSSDPFVGKLGILRVHQGTITAGSQLYVGDARKPFKVGHLYRLQGKDRIEIERAGPGDICAVAKVDALHFDAVLHDATADAHIHLLPLALPVPVHGLAITPKRHGDEQRLWELLQRLVDEDPCLRLEQMAGTQETVVRGLGELQLRTVLERLREQHKFEVDTAPPRIAYRETITAPADAQYRHKKQSGGAGQFGEVHLRVAPLARGEGFRFVDAVKGGTIPGQYMAAVEKGVREALDAGVISGHPLVDIEVTVYDGKHHSVDSKDVAFATAARKAVIAAVQAAAPIVLEPIAKVDINAPEASTGDITGDLSSRRGQVAGTEAQVGGLMLIRALAPLAELVTWQTRLNALTAGQGRFTLALSHFEPVPPQVQQSLTAGKAAMVD